MKDPINIAIAVLGAGILALLGKYIVTDKLDKEVLGLLTTLFSTAITISQTRKPNAKEEPETPLPGDKLPPLPPLPPEPKEDADAPRA